MENVIKMGGITNAYIYRVQYTDEYKTRYPSEETRYILTDYPISDDGIELSVAESISFIFHREIYEIRLNSISLMDKLIAIDIETFEELKIEYLFIERSK